MFMRKVAVSLIFYFISLNLYATDTGREAQYASEIAVGIAKSEVVWLGESNNRFLALYSESEKSDFNRTVILLPQMGSHPDTDPLIYALRRELTKHNWATLALQMPLREAGAAEADYFPLLPEAKQRIAEAVRHSAANGAQSIVVVGHQLGALMALYGQANEPMQEIKAVVTIGLNVPETNSKNAQTIELIKQVKIPFLDIYGAQDRKDIVASARERRIAARENKQYRQFQLNRASSPYWNDQDLVVKRIYGWLSHY
ncbi:MAG: alpha/beta hydrolase family protein [Methylococcaceae bacterium]|nr:alpha/beta hydrolase family protein [Methylococcaceae bacterium]